MNLKTRIIDKIIDTEGGYVDDPLDSGGETKYGITKQTATMNGYNGEMKALTEEQAFDIYVGRYWDAMSLDEIEKLSPEIAEELMDTAVNLGVSRAAKFLQRSLNVLNNSGVAYPDIVVDGVIHDDTVRAFNAYVLWRGESGVLLKMLNSLQGAYYITLAERREKDERFVYGWFRNRVR